MEGHGNSAFSNRMRKPIMASPTSDNSKTCLEKCSNDFCYFKYWEHADSLIIWSILQCTSSRRAVFKHSALIVELQSFFCHFFGNGEVRAACYETLGGRT